MPQPDQPAVVFDFPELTESIRRGMIRMSFRTTSRNPVGRNIHRRGAKGAEKM